MKDTITLRANQLQSASHPVPSQDAGSWAEYSRVQSSAYNDPCSADVKAPSSVDYYPLPQTAYSSATEPHQWSGSGDPWLNTILHDHQWSKSLSKPGKKEDKGKGEVSKLILDSAVFVQC